MSEGFVSLKSSSNQVPIKILRNTGATQSLLLEGVLPLNVFIYLRFYVTFNTVQVISQRVVGMAEETSRYSWSRFCTVNCQPTESNYQLFHLRLCREPNPGLRGGRQSYHSATVVPAIECKHFYW